MDSSPSQFGKIKPTHENYGLSTSDFNTIEYINEKEKKRYWLVVLIKLIQRACIIFLLALIPIVTVVCLNNQSNLPISEIIEWCINHIWVPIIFAVIMAYPVWMILGIIYLALEGEKLWSRWNDRIDSIGKIIRRKRLLLELKWSRKTYEEQQAKYLKFKESIQLYEKERNDFLRKEEESMVDIICGNLDNIYSNLKYKRNYSLIKELHDSFFTELDKIREISKTSESYYAKKRLENYESISRWISDKAQGAKYAYKAEPSKDSDNTTPKVISSSAELEEKNKDTTVSLEQNFSETATTDKSKDQHFTQFNQTNTSAKTEKKELTKQDIVIHEKLNDIFNGTDIPKDAITERITLNEKTLSTEKLQIDYQEALKNNIEIGFEGEIFVVGYEKKRLSKLSRNDLSDTVIHASKEIGDGLGYDIISWDHNGNKLFIEVKTTSGDIYTQFYLTSNEISVLKKGTNYCIYRVYNFDFNTGEGDIYIINGEKDIEKYFEIRPLNYRIVPKKR
jgi:hypothetical protein